MARTRRKRGSGRARHRTHWLWRGAWIAATAAAFLAIGGYLGLRAYLHSDEFRVFLAGKAGHVLKADADFAPFHWDGLQVSSSTFEADGGPYFSHLRADDLRTEIGLGEVRRGVWLLRTASVRRLEVEIPGDSASPATPETPASRPGKTAAAWLPKSARLEELRIDESIVTGHIGGVKVAARGQSVLVRPGAKRGAFEIDAEGGTIEHPFRWFPEPQLHHARFRTSGTHLYLLDAESKVYSNGLLDLSGEASLDNRDFTFEGGAVGINCDEVFSEDWAKRLLGRIGTRFTVRGHDGETSVTGQLAVRDAVLTALPMLDRLAAYADTTRFRTLSLKKARTDFAWNEGRLSLTKFLISAEGLMRLEGHIDITGDRLDGHFRLGLAPGTLAQIPGAESTVFAERRDGLMWTPLRITGTLDHPEEDLSARLIQAAGDRMFEILPETGARVLKFTRTAVGEAPAQAGEAGTQARATGADVIRDATGIARDIGGLFGLLPPEAPPAEPDPPRAPEHKR
jgi:hypothetical protein